MLSLGLLNGRTPVPTVVLYQQWARRLPLPAVTPCRDTTRGRRTAVATAHTRFRFEAHISTLVAFSRALIPSTVSCCFTICGSNSFA